jgi:hypothetical protein
MIRSSSKRQKNKGAGQLGLTYFMWRDKFKNAPGSLTGGSERKRKLSSRRQREGYLGHLLFTLNFAKLPLSFSCFNRYKRKGSSFYI